MNIKVQDFRTKFQNVALTADNVLIFLRISRHLGFLSPLGCHPKEQML